MASSLTFTPIHLQSYGRSTEARHVCEVDTLIQKGFGEVRQKRQSLAEKWMHSKDPAADYLILNSMTVLPEYERKGLGAALLREGIEMARKANVPIYLIATPAGRGFYERHGFEVLEDCEQGDGEQMQWTETVMRWPAHWESSSSSRRPVVLARFA